MLPFNEMLKRALPVIGVALAGTIVLTLVALGGGRGATAPSVETSGPMPALDEPAMRGEGRIRTEELRGKIVLVNFWASWCGPCRLEQPALERLSQEFDEEVAFLGVNFGDDRAAALEYLREFDVSYPSVEDRDGRIAHRFLVPYLPATVLVDRTGEMRYRLLGEQTEESFRRYLVALLREAP